MVRIWIFTLLLAAVSAHAGEIEVFAGANSTTYDETSEANTWGISLRAQYNFTHADNGWFININSPGISPAASLVSGGYIWRTTGSDFFWEWGVGGGYGLVFGPQVEGIGGFGYRITSNFYFDFPIVLGTSTGVQWTPYLGFSF